jgi:hypothetical protein
LTRLLSKILPKFSQLTLSSRTLALGSRASFSHAHLTSIKWCSSRVAVVLRVSVTVWSTCSRSKWCSLVDLQYCLLRGAQGAPKAQEGQSKAQEGGRKKVKKMVTYHTMNRLDDGGWSLPRDGARGPLAPPGGRFGPVTQKNIFFVL